MRDARASLGEGAGLVERDGARPADGFEGGAALDEQSVARSGAQGARDGGGHAQHERARAADEQQRDSPVERVGKVRPGEQHRHEGREGRDEHHGGRVDAAEAVDEARDGRSGGLGVLDEADDAGDGVVVRLPFDPDDEDAVRGDAARVHGVARAAVDGDALARDGGIVEVRLAVRDGAVRGDAVPHADLDEITGAQGAHGHVDDVPAAQEPGRGRRERGERPDACARAARGDTFEEFAHREEEDDDGGLRGLPDEESADRGERDEGVDAQRRARAGSGGRAPGDGPGADEGGGGVPETGEARLDEAEEEREREERARADDEAALPGAVPGPRLVFVGGRLAGPDGPGGVAELAQGAFDGLPRRARLVEGEPQRSGGEVGARVRGSGRPFERPFDLADARRAVHALHEIFERDGFRRGGGAAHDPMIYEHLLRCKDI